MSPRVDGRIVAHVPAAPRIAAAQMLGRRQLVQVLFGHHPGDEPPPLVDDTGMAAALFPYRLPLWELDHC